ncbi:hypothetical protein [Cohnella sp.]
MIKEKGAAMAESKKLSITEVKKVLKTYDKEALISQLSQSTNHLESMSL